MSLLLGSSSYVYHITRLNKEFKSDLQWWHLLATNLNGISFLLTLLTYGTMLP